MIEYQLAKIRCMSGSYIYFTDCLARDIEDEYDVVFKEIGS
jgi:hypothetical protein